MCEFTSDEIKVLTNSIEFYKYEMNKTDDMDQYRAWKSLQQKIDDKLQYYRGEWSLKDNDYPLKYKRKKTSSH